MKINDIKWNYPLSFNDVVEFIPNLTTDNEVISDEIIHLEILLNTYKLDVFFDTETSEYCYPSYSSSDLNQIADEYGESILSEFSRFNTKESFMLNADDSISSVHAKMLEECAFPVSESPTIDECIQQIEEEEAAKQKAKSPSL